MADRFFAPDLPKNGLIRLEGDEARHLARVARRQVGDLVEIFSGNGDGFLAQVMEIHKDHVDLAVREPVIDRRAALELTLLVAPPKGDRFDWIVEKATELGVCRLIPILCDRSVVDPRLSKIERLKRVVIESTKQCGRNQLMTLDRPAAFSSVVSLGANTSRLFADAGGISPQFWPKFSANDQVSLAIGPEGGWTDEERQVALDAGWIAVGLGQTRLRVETAAIAGVAIVFSRLILEDGS